MSHELPSSSDHQRRIIEEFDRREQELTGQQRIMGRRLDPEECEVASRNYVQVVLSYLGDTMDDRDVLEVGTGIGRFTPHLADRARSLVGIDFSRRMVEATRQEMGAHTTGRVLLSQASATNLPLRDNSVDAVFASEVYFHLPGDDDFGNAMTELQRVLRPGGIAFISEALSETGQSRHIHDYLRFRTLEEYEQALSPLTIGNIATTQVIDQTNTMFLAQ
jgi:ubiquinone/menaquinone biosynthesis C-methylase UbiE